MKLIDLMKTIAIYIVIVLSTVSCLEEPSLEPLKRDTDAISLAYNNGALGKVSVRYGGNWSTRIECTDSEGHPTEDWFSVSPTEGMGNAKDYQWVEITATRNPGDERKATLYLISEDGKENAIEISQASGHFSVESPVISGSLKSKSASTAFLKIAYDKAFGDEEIEVTSSLSGATNGLSIESPFSTSIEKEGSGEILIPLKGTPTELGELIANVVFKLNSKTIFDGKISTAVSSSNVVFKMGFDLFLWGGNYPDNKAGTTPNPSNKTAGKEYMGSEPAAGTVTAGTDGTNDVFLTMTDTYRINRGIEGWSGTRVYEHPGYIKLGITGRGGWVMTPEIKNLSATAQDVVVSIDFMRFDNENGTYRVTAEGAGTILNPVVNSTLLPSASSSAGRKWTTLNFNLSGATNKTKIKIAVETDNQTGCRMNIDNVQVMAQEVETVEAPLATPDVEAITYAPGDDNIKINWVGVEGATSYEASIAPQDSPDFRKTIITSDASHTFTDIEPGIYVLYLKALYEPKPEFNSPEINKLVHTKGFAVEKLNTPENISVTSYSATSVSLGWDNVSGASNYKITIKDSDNSDVKSVIVSENKGTVDGLLSGTDYNAYVVALAGDGSEPNPFDSDECSVYFKTAEPEILSTPSLKLFSKTHAYAILEFIFNKDEQNTEYFNLRVYDGSTIIREYTSFKFSAKYRKHAIRFIVSGLDANKEYSLSIQRKTLDSNLYSDSDWCAPFAFTTNNTPDRSGYLLWNDFDNHPWGGNGPNVAHGIDPKDSDKTFDVVTGVSTKGWALASPVKNMDNVINGVGKDEANRREYQKIFMSDWAAEDFTSSILSTVYLCAGMMKFGTGSGAGKLGLPLFTELTSASTLELTFNSAPYTEPNSSTGDLEMPAIYEGKEFTLAISGPGEISTVDDQAVNATSTKINNKLIEDTNPNTLKYYPYTPHKVIITGATAETRITFSTENATGKRRMWLDDIKVLKVE